MGSHIDVIFAREIESPHDISERLNDVFRDRSVELQAVSHDSYDSMAVESITWDFLAVPCDGEVPYYLSEGPLGFSVYLYKNCCCLSIGQRFWQLYDPASVIKTPLRGIIEAVVRSLTVRPIYATLAGGFGDSDAVLDLAYYDGSSFTAICDALDKSLGKPANSWSEMSSGETPWCLIELATAPRITQE